MSAVRMIIGDTRTVLPSLRPNSVDLLLTSPPFLLQRDYVPAGHASKELEIGTEREPAEYIDHMIDVVEAAVPALTPHGSIAIEIGDTRSGSGGAGGDYLEDGLREGQPTFKGSAYNARYNDGTQPRTRPGRTRAEREGWPLDKSVCLIPEMLRFSLAYGFNPLSGRRTDKWRIRSVVRWIKTNPGVGAIGDRYRDATSEMLIACKAEDRWFDLDAVRHDNPRANEFSRIRAQMNKGSGGYHTGDSIDNVTQNPNGAPPLDWWLISPSSYKGSHYATWPEQLCVIPIESMCPRRVCTLCGAPSRRISYSQRTLDGEPTNLGAISDDEKMGEGASGVGHWRKETERSTIGWSACDCHPELWDEGWRDQLELLRSTHRKAASRKTPKAEAEALFRDEIPIHSAVLLAMYRGRQDGFHLGDNWRPGVVLDPFGGSGTTGVVASALGRDCILIDLDERNAKLVDERVGMFLQGVEYGNE